MSLTIRQISGRKELTQFVQFQIDLLSQYPAFVPPMIDSEVDCLDPAKNPAFEFCEAVFYMAFDDEKPVGRIAGIVNHRVNELHNLQNCRICYFDFIDDVNVSSQLLHTVKEWGKSKGMNKLVGPLGLTDLDYEGCLMEGFDQLATAVELYNPAYYERHYKAYGMTPEAWWDGFIMTMPDSGLPDKYTRIANIVQKRFDLRVLKILDAKKLVAQYGKKIFDLYNEAYAPLYGACPLTEKQIDYYIKMYLPQVRLDLIRLIVDKDDNLIAFGIACPSLSRAQQQAKGKMWPFGWFYLARTMYLTNKSWLGKLLHGGTDRCDLLLVGVRPDWQGKGVNALLFTDLFPQFAQNGYFYVETNNELETNHKIQNMWLDFDPVRHKRRCTFAIAI